MEYYIVVCRAAIDGPYELATRTVFHNKLAAESYRDTLPEWRQALVILGDFENLRFRELRGTAKYWLKMLYPAPPSAEKK